jgi:hypothetical protein
VLKLLWVVVAAFAVGCGGRSVTVVGDGADEDPDDAGGVAPDDAGGVAPDDAGDDVDAGGMSDTDAGHDAGTVKPTPPLRECGEDAECDDSEHCTQGLCLSACKDLGDLIVPAGESRPRGGVVDYCNVVIAGTVEVQPFSGKEGGQLELRAEKRIVILETGSIVADGCGHPSNQGPGAGGCNGGGSDGGGYGGEGGPSCCDGLPGPIYGDPDTMSIEMGSGGGAGRGCSEGLGGTGGGAIALFGESIVIAGVLSANGTGELEPSKWSPGGGSGGGILLVAESHIDLSGRVSARGGTPSPAIWGGGGGGGGRVKLFAPSGTLTGEIDVTGGDGGEGQWFGSPGGAGSAFTTF